ncbi:DNA translocase FtsK [Cerasibacillus terrae]
MSDIMWERIKKKLEKILWEEVEVEVEEEYNPAKQFKIEQEPPIKTKVTYQYPNQKKFPFPLIPDQPNRPKERDKETVEVPAYKRRRHIEKQVSTDTLEVKKKESTKQEQRKRAPFRPSRVASPIYGYQKRRENRQVEQVPTFLRKRNEEKQKNNQTKVKVQQEKESSQIHPKSIDKTEHIQENDLFVRNQTNEVAATIEKQPLASNVIKHDEKKRHRSEDLASEKVNEVKSNELRKKNHVEKQQKKKQQSTVGKTPFNVIMTPRDKKRIHEQQEKFQQQQKMKHTHVPLHLLNDSETDNQNIQPWIQEQTTLLEKTLKHFNVQAEVVRVSQGPSVTRFEVKPEIGVKVSKIRNLSDDLKLNMAAKDIRIEAPIPGKNTVGIEVPNQTSRMVTLQEIFETDAFKKSTSSLPVALGLDIEGTPVITTIDKMPHGLIAGATGSGKSVCINSILVSILYKSSYKDVKFLLIDPKMVELAPYNGIPHLISPVITDVKAATAALKWAVNEMEERYERFVEEGVRDIGRFNEKVIQQGRMEEKMPYLVIVIDELADLMMVSPQDVEDAICRIAQKARAAGIHLLVATQRPSVDVITGLIKANIPTRIAFSVSSQVDSRTIIDHAGAEKLLGKGDMLFLENGAGKSVRLQGPFVSDDEIERITAYVRKLAKPDYAFEQETLLEQVVTEEEEDELLSDVIRFVMDVDKASTSLLQRQFRIGYNRAARLVDSLEKRGIISEQNGSKPREVLLSKGQYEQIQNENEQEI